MKLTEMITLWDALPDFSTEEGAISFEAFAEAVYTSVGITVDILTDKEDKP